MNDTILSVSELTKAYGHQTSKTYALSNVSFSVSEGSFTAIIGRSGSGKSTLLNTIGGLEAPSGGNVIVKGQDLYAMPDSARTAFRRRNIGYVFQFFNLIPELTVYENICLPSYLDRKRPDRNFTDQVMEKLGLISMQEKYPAELSGGEQQRTAVARALAHKPAILLADEPTGNLDRRNGDELMALLHFSHRFFRQTILLVTHDLEIARSAERIITLEDGHILSDVGGDDL